MTQVAHLNAEKREETGKGPARRLREAGKIPSIIYGAGKEEVNISLERRELVKEYSKGSFLSKLYEISLGEEKIRVIPRDIQVHPVTDIPEHADFLRVEKDSKVNVWIKINVVGREKSKGIKRGGVLNVVRHSVEFWVSPENIPTEITVDVSSLMIGDSVHINDIILPEGITPTIDRNFTVVTVAGRMAKLEEEDVLAATAEGEEGAAEAAEGEDAAEGEGGEEAKKE